MDEHAFPPMGFAVAWRSAIRYTGLPERLLLDVTPILFIASAIILNVLEFPRNHPGLPERLLLDIPSYIASAHYRLNSKNKVTLT